MLKPQLAGDGESDQKTRRMSASSSNDGAVQRLGGVMVGRAVAISSSARVQGAGVTSRARRCNARRGRVGCAGWNVLDARCARVQRAGRARGVLDARVEGGEGAWGARGV